MGFGTRVDASNRAPWNPSTAAAAAPAAASAEASHSLQRDLSFRPCTSSRRPTPSESRSPDAVKHITVSMPNAWPVLHEAGLGDPTLHPSRRRTQVPETDAAKDSDSIADGCGGRVDDTIDCHVEMLPSPGSSSRGDASTGAAGGGGSGGGGGGGATSCARQTGRRTPQRDADRNNGRLLERMEQLEKARKMYERKRIEHERATRAIQAAYQKEVADLHQRIFNVERDKEVLAEAYEEKQKELDAVLGEISLSGACMAQLGGHQQHRQHHQHSRQQQHNHQQQHHHQHNHKQQRQEQQLEEFDEEQEDIQSKFEAYDRELEEMRGSLEQERVARLEVEANFQSLKEEADARLSGANARIESICRGPDDASNGRPAGEDEECSTDKERMLVEQLERAYALNEELERELEGLLGEAGEGAGEHNGSLNGSLRDSVIQARAGRGNSKTPKAKRVSAAPVVFTAVLPMTPVPPPRRPPNHARQRGEAGDILTDSDSRGADDGDASSWGDVDDDENSMPNNARSWRGPGVSGGRRDVNALRKNLESLRALRKGFADKAARRR